MKIAQPADRGEPRTDRAYPQPGEAIGVKRSSRRGVQRSLIDGSTASCSDDSIEKGAAGSPADMGHAVLLDQLLRTVSRCTTWAGSICGGPRCEAAANLAKRNVLVV